MTAPIAWRPDGSQSAGDRVLCASNELRDLAVPSETFYRLHGSHRRRCTDEELAVSLTRASTVKLDAVHI